MAGTPFDPKTAQPGTMLYGVDPTSLIAGRDSLKQHRMTFQRELQRQGIQRYTPVTVNLEGIVRDGNHAVRVAIEDNRTVDVLVVDAATISYGDLRRIPIER